MIYFFKMFLSTILLLSIVIVPFITAFYISEYYAVGIFPLMGIMIVVTSFVLSLLMYLVTKTEE